MISYGRATQFLYRALGSSYGDRLLAAIVQRIAMLSWNRNMLYQIIRPESKGCGVGAVLGQLETGGYSLLAPWHDNSVVHAHAAALDLGLSECRTEFFGSLHSDSVVLQEDWPSRLVCKFGEAPEPAEAELRQIRIVLAGRRKSRVFRDAFEKLSQYHLEPVLEYPSAWVNTSEEWTDVRRGYVPGFSCVSFAGDLP